MNALHYPVPRVWKVASRWSEDGSPDSSVLDLFREHKVVFVGRVPERFAQVAIGDLIVVSNGTTVVAMGAVVSEPAPVTSLGIPFSPPELARFHYEDWVLGCRVDWVDLQEQDFVSYRIGAFHEVHENAGHYRDLYSRYLTATRNQAGFAIHARSCSLYGRSADSGEPLWEESIRYVIPVFQRPYSWGQTEVSKLVNDLLDAFTGRTGGPPFEPVFIGTMQIGSRLNVKGVANGFEWEHEVIDGQQRLTTLLLLLRALEEIPGQSGQRLPEDYRRRLHTKIGDGVQQRHLVRALASEPGDIPAEPELNAYWTNLELLRQIIATAPELALPETRTAFAGYLVTQVYFVVIETRAGLSKTLQIFKAINTTGLDLDGGDVFKIRFYEYRRLLGDGEGVLRLITQLYDGIDARNDQAGKVIARMEDILSIARHYFATEAGLPHAARLAAGSTFFERFFEVVVNRQPQVGFVREKCESIELTTQLFEELIDIRFRWEEEIYPSLGAEAKAMVDFIWWGRYASYYEVLYLFCHRFDPTITGVERFAIALSKLLSLHSLLYERVNEGRKRFMHELLDRFAKGRTGETIDSIIAYIEDVCAGRRADLVRGMVNDQLAWLSTKHLVCRMLAMRAELWTEPRPPATELSALLFEQDIDIEHIEACNHEDGSKQDAWGPELHRLGNLIVLERSKNRGSEVSNKDYARTKRTAYQSSSFGIVRDFAANYTTWDLESARGRKQALAREITDYLCGPELSESSVIPS
ncbi:MAG: DUF262 domain-containing HNH endonuclease family protein [Luteolibacter sp.]